jgi:hypothetical protein
MAVLIDFGRMLPVDVQVTVPQDIGSLSGSCGAQFHEDVFPDDSDVFNGFPLKPIFPLEIDEVHVNESDGIVGEGKDLDLTSDTERAKYLSYNEIIDDIIHPALSIRIPPSLIACHEGVQTSHG